MASDDGRQVEMASSVPDVERQRSFYEGRLQKCNAKCAKLGAELFAVEEQLEGSQLSSSTRRTLQSRQLQLQSELRDATAAKENARIALDAVPHANSGQQAGDALPSEK